MKPKSSAPPDGRRRLIVNADDFGLSPGVNAGVAAAHTGGILTSATLLANAPGFDEAVAIARAHPRLGVGVHLNLVRGRPLSPAGEVALLVDGDGVFRRFRTRRMTAAFLAQAEAEYRRQLERVLDAGIGPTHIDFEKHHAWQGPLYRLACRLAGERGIAAARNLAEPVAWSLRRLGWPGAARAAMAAVLRAGFDLGGGRRCVLTRPDRMLGQTHIGGMDQTVWLRLLAAVPAGVSEVMTHPGTAEAVETPGDMGGSWLKAARGVELAALTSARVMEAARRSGIEFIHFGDLR